MKFTDLVTDQDGRLSHTKLAANGGFLVLSAAFIKMAWTGAATPELFLVYGGLTTAYRLMSKWIGQKFEALTGVDK